MLALQPAAQFFWSPALVAPASQPQALDPNRVGSRGRAAGSPRAFLQPRRAVQLITVPPLVARLTADAERTTGLGHRRAAVVELFDEGELLLPGQMIV